MVRDKGRAYVEVRIRLPGVDHRFIPLEEEDRVRETGRNDGKADVFCGVPQGSVLGRLLWNIAYDRVLTRTVLPEGVSLTLLLATGRGWAEIRERAETGLHATVEAIWGIGLRVSLPKTVAFGFHRPRNPQPRDISISVDDVRIG